MRVDVILSPEEVVHHDLAGRVGVVIDVFRFTTTVLAALEAGIERFYPVGEVEEAWRLKASHPKLLLAGERNALKIPGFDFGNSPLEHHGRRYQGESWFSPPPTAPGRCGPLEKLHWWSWPACARPRLRPLTWRIWGRMWC